MECRPGAAAGPVLVTGGTGFLGREIVGQLVASGVETHVLARATSARGPLAHMAVTWHEGDLCAEDSIERAVGSLAGRSLRVIHAAALISYRSRDRELSKEVNLAGTARLLAASRRHGVARFVYVSSVVTVGHCVGREALDESARFNNGDLGVAYVDTKRAAEDLALAAAPDLATVVVNPGAIFGPVERTSNTVRFIRRIAQGRPPPFVPPGSVGVVGVRDAARGTIAAMERGRSGERYLLVESSLSTRELLARMAAHLGARAATRVVPVWAWKALTGLASAWDAAFPMQLTPPQALRMLGLDLRFDSSKARAELGWSPQPFDEVLSETIAHLRARGELERRD